MKILPISVRTVKISLSILILTSLFSIDNGFAAPPPVSINISDAYMSGLSPERRRVVEAIVDGFNKLNLTSMADYQTVLPPSKIEGLDSTIIQISDLFQGGTRSDDLVALSRDEHGRKLKLNDAQLESFRKNALIEVPSKEFPGKFHVWQIHGAIQKGSDHIQVSFQEDVGSMLGHIYVSLPANFVGGKPTSSDEPTSLSVSRGIKSFLYGMRGVLASLIGVIEKTPKYSMHDVEVLISKKKKEYQIETARNAMQSPNSQVKFDESLYDEKLDRDLQPEVERIQSQSAEYCREHDTELRRKLLKEFRHNFSQATRGQLQSIIDREVSNAKQDHLKTRFRTDPVLEQKAPGYGALLANRLEASQILLEHKENLRLLVAQFKQNTREKLKRENPYLGTNASWLEPRVHEATLDYGRSRKWEVLQDAADELDQKGLIQEAELARASAEFEEGEEQQYRERLTREKKTANTVEFESPIWLSSNWKKETILNSDGSFNRYSPITTETRQVSTDYWFWRWHSVLERVYSHFKAGVHWFWLKNLWNGPIGLKSQFMTDSQFCSEQMMDRHTGNIVDDPNAKETTYCGRMRAIWNDYYAGKREVEEQPDNGMISRNVWRRLYYITGGARWLGYTLGVGISQPVMTTANTVVSGAALVTMPAWVAFTSLFMWTIDSFLYDTQYPGNSEQVGHPSQSAFPIPSYLIWNMGVAGVGQSVAMTAKSICYDCTTAPIAKGLYAAAHKGARTFWDWTVRSTLNSLSLLRVPGADSRPGSGSAWRIRGPGLTSKIYYQIEQPVAQLALLAQLEKEELSLFTQEENAKIERPVNEFYNFFRTIAGPLEITPPSDVAKGMVKEHDSNAEKLNEATHLRQRKLAEATTLPGYAVRSQIKLSEAGLRETLENSSRVVESFYSEHLLSRMNEQERAKFWLDKQIEEGDFEELTRYYFAEVFDNDFLIPLEKTDEDVVITVTNDRLAHIFDGILPIGGQI